MAGEGRIKVNKDHESSRGLNLVLFWLCTAQKTGIHLLLIVVKPVGAVESMDERRRLKREGRRSSLREW